jgi:xanthosine utilization system XapX-like protein
MASTITTIVNLSAAANPAGRRGVEKLLTCVEEPPWNALYRVGIGWLASPALLRVYGEEPPAWAWVLWFLGILVALRIVPLIARRLLPFSDAVRATWFERRQLSRHYDSYQWRKLFWIGAGLAVHTMRSDRLQAAPIVLAVIFLISGALGLAAWSVTKVRARPPR